MYWYYVYKWKRYNEPTSEWKEAVSVFQGEFHQLILFAVGQPEQWIVTYVKEINARAYHELCGKID